MKALPELTKRPAPIAPPLEAPVSSRRYCYRHRLSPRPVRGAKCEGGRDLHGNHLHVPALEVLVQLVAAGAIGNDHALRVAVAIRSGVVGGRAGMLLVVVFETHRGAGRKEGRREGEEEREGENKQSRAEQSRAMARGLDK